MKSDLSLNNIIHWEAYFFNYNFTSMSTTPSNFALPLNMVSSFKFVWGAPRGYGTIVIELPKGAAIDDSVIHGPKGDDVILFQLYYGTRFVKIPDNKIGNIDDPEFKNNIQFIVLNVDKRESNDPNERGPQLTIYLQDAISYKLDFLGTKMNSIVNFEPTSKIPINSVLISASNKVRKTFKDWAQNLSNANKSTPYTLKKTHLNECFSQLFSKIDKIKTDMRITINPKNLYDDILDYLEIHGIKVCCYRGKLYFVTADGIEEIFTKRGSATLIDERVVTDNNPLRPFKLMNIDHHNVEVENFKYFVYNASTKKFDPVGVDANTTLKKFLPKHYNLKVKIPDQTLSQGNYFGNNEKIKLDQLQQAFASDVVLAEVSPSPWIQIYSIADIHKSPTTNASESAGGIFMISSVSDVYQGDMLKISLLLVRFWEPEEKRGKL